MSTVFVGKLLTTCLTAKLHDALQHFHGGWVIEDFYFKKIFFPIFLGKSWVILRQSRPVGSILAEKCSAILIEILTCNSALNKQTVSSVACKVQFVHTFLNLRHNGF